MEPSSFLKGVILLQPLGNDIFLKLLVVVVGVSGQGGALFHKLEDVDH